MLYKNFIKSAQGASVNKYKPFHNLFQEKEIHDLLYANKKLRYC